LDYLLRGEGAMRISVGRRRRIDFDLALATVNKMTPVFGSDVHGRRGECAVAVEESELGFRGLA
jgi:hypothetical protein